MAVRSFIFCDVCNRQAIRYVEQRRSLRRADAGGKRITDNRAWFDGDAAAAVKHGWVVTSSNQHVCPRCAERLESNPELLDAWDS